MPYTDDHKVVEGKTVEAIEDFPERLVVRLSDGIDLDIRVDDNGKRSLGIRVP